MQNITTEKYSPQDEEQSAALQHYFQAKVSPDDIEQVFVLKKSQPLLQAFTALFHGGFNGVLVRLLVLRELVVGATSSTLTRADINFKLSYLNEDSLETVLLRMRTHQLLVWDAGQGV